MQPIREISEVHTAQITTAARTLGLSVFVDQGVTWRIENGTICIGTGYYRGTLTDDPLTAMVILDLWATVILNTPGTGRTHRRATLERERPELAPLLATIDRIQALGEVLIAYPGFREPLRVAFTRIFSLHFDTLHFDTQHPGATQEQPSEPGTAFLAGVLLEAIHPDTQTAQQQSLQIALTPTHPLDRERTFLRLLALLLPAYEEHLSATTGLTHLGGNQPDETDPETPNLDATDLGEPPSNADLADEQDEETARSGGGEEHAEGADLFEAEHAGTLTRMLDTPMPVTAAHALATEHDDQANTPETRDPSTAPLRLGDDAARDDAARQVNLAAYRHRITTHQHEIDAMRDVWRTLIHDRTEARRTLSRTPVEEGHTLHLEHLPQAVAEALAGNPHPRAYAQPTIRTREREDTGNIDLIIAIDRSSSMRPVAPAAADAAMVMIEALAAVNRDIETEEQRLGMRIDTRIRTALLVYDSLVHVVKPLTAHVDDASRAELYSRVLTTRGGTNDTEMFAEVLRQFTHTPGHRRRIVMVVTDGGSSDPVSAASALERLRSQGIVVCGIGVQADAVRERFTPLGVSVRESRDIVGVMEQLLTRVAEAE